MRHAKNNNIKPRYKNNSIRNKQRRKACHHIWYTQYKDSFTSNSGLLLTTEVKRCKLCGKTKTIDRWKDEGDDYI